MTIRSAASIALLAVPLVVLAGCASRAPLTVTVATPAPIPVVVERPAGAADNLRLPPRLADGAFATPNHALTGDAALWHLRAGLNVAALACRGPDEAMLLAGYNRFLTAYKPQLATAQRALAVSHGTVDGFDQAMTRLYNYWALPPAQAGFCAAAAQVIAQAATVPADGLPGFAQTALAELDRPFTDFYGAYAAWRDARAAGTTFAAVAPVTAVAEVESAAPVPSPASLAIPAPVKRPAPRATLGYDAAVFRLP